MTDNGQLDFLDILTVMSFIIGLINLDENVTQSDKQELQHDLADKADMLLEEIHKHLEEQDIKLDHILQMLKEIEDGSKRNI